MCALEFSQNCVLGARSNSKGFWKVVKESELFKAEKKKKKRTEKSELVPGHVFYTEQEWHPVVKKIALNAS